MYTTALTSLNKYYNNPYSGPLGNSSPVEPSIFGNLPPITAFNASGLSNSMPYPSAQNNYNMNLPTNIFAQYSQLGNPFEFSGLNPMNFYIPPVQYPPPFIVPMPKFNFTAPNLSYATPTQNAQGSAYTPRTGDRNSIQGNGKLDPAFVNRVKQAAQRINCDWEDLMAIMFSESGLNPHCGLRKNGSVANAVGLIQFLDCGGIACLKQHYGINITRGQLVRMGAVQQMDYVEKVFLASKKSAGYKSSDRLDGPTLYALIFLPARARRDVLCVKGEKDKNGKRLSYYEDNPLDHDKDGDIDKKDMAVRIDKKHKEMKKHFFA